MATSLEWWARTRRSSEALAIGSVCIADADQQARERMAHALAALGYRAHETNTVGAAIFIAAQINLRAVVLNLMLDDGCAIAGISKIREASPDAFILALLPEKLSAAPILMELAYRAGADATLAAPVSAEQLCAALTESAGPVHTTLHRHDNHAHA